MAASCMNDHPQRADVTRIPNLKRKISYKIFEFYDQQTIVDVTFRVSNPIALIPAHRLILSAASPYFKALFNSENGTYPMIEIKDIDSDTFERLIVFCYTGETFLTKANAYKLLKSARVFQLNTTPISVTMTATRQLGSTSIPKEVTYFSEVLMSKINELYEEQELTDVTFKLSNPCVLVKAHRLILSAASPYFQNLFTSDRGNYPQIEILDVDSESFQQLVTACYTGSVHLRMDHVSKILKAARILQIKDIADTCTDYLLENLVGISLMAIQTRGSNVNRSVLRYNQREHSWEKLFDIKVSATNFGIVHSMELVYFIGGIIKDKVNNRAVAFNILTKAKTKLPSMNHPRYDLSVSILNGKVYVIGGRTSNSKILQSVEMLDTHEWMEVGNLITPRFGAGAVAIAGKIFIMGGYNGGDLKSVECYNPNTKIWKACKDMNLAHYMPGVVAHRGHIYVLGGWSIASHAVVERYDINMNAWTKVCLLDVGRCAIACVSIGNLLWAVGGAFEGEQKDCVSVYDEQCDKWTNKNPIIEAGVYYCLTLDDI